MSLKNNSLFTNTAGRECILFDQCCLQIEKKMNSLIDTLFSLSYLPTTRSCHLLSVPNAPEWNSGFRGWFLSHPLTHTCWSLALHSMFQSQRLFAVRRPFYGTVVCSADSNLPCREHGCVIDFWVLKYAVLLLFYSYN